MIFLIVANVEHVKSCKYAANKTVNKNIYYLDEVQNCLVCKCFFDESELNVYFTADLSLESKTLIS